MPMSFHADERLMRRPEYHTTLPLAVRCQHAVAVYATTPRHTLMPSVSSCQWVAGHVITLNTNNANAARHVINNSSPLPFGLATPRPVAAH